MHWKKTEFNQRGWNPRGTMGSAKGEWGGGVRQNDANGVPTLLLRTGTFTGDHSSSQHASTYTKTFTFQYFYQAYFGAEYYWYSTLLPK